MGALINILAVFSSPRTGSLSSAMHRAFLDSFEPGTADITEINVYDPQPAPCTACGKCRESGFCCEDSVMNSYYPLIKNCGLISVSFPVYFSCLPGPLKNFIDRCQLLWEESERGGVFKRKKGLLFCTAGSEYENVFGPSLTVIRHFFNTVNAELIKEFSIMLPGTDAPGVTAGAVLEEAGRISGKINNESDN